MRNYLQIFSLLVIAIASYPSYANDVAKRLCESLERPAIDCMCVSQRIANLQAVGGSANVSDLLLQRYAHTLGLENTMMESLQSFHADPMSAMSTTLSYESFGGMPETVDEFERGCAIETDQKFVFETVEADSPSEKLINARVVSLGEGQRRNSICVVQRMRTYLSDAEISAYHLSFSHYEGDHSNDDQLSRAKALGLSLPVFQQLEQSARSKLKQREEADSNYCEAITYVENLSAAQIKADRQSEKARFSSLAATAKQAPSSLTSYDDKAYQLMASGCKKEGNSDQHCQCVIDDFEKKIVAKASRPGVVLSWVVMNQGSNMDPMELMQIMQAGNNADRTEATQLLMQAGDVGENCRSIASASTQLEGSPRQKMMTICMSDVEDESICGCLTDKMQSRLNENDFELLVDMREAEYLGADDPLAKVAEDRGLTRAQAEQALGNNQSLIGGMMNMDMLSCVGGLPSMPNMPNFEGFPTQ